MPSLELLQEIGWLPCAVRNVISQLPAWCFVIIVNVLNPHDGSFGPATGLGRKLLQILKNWYKSLLYCASACRLHTHIPILHHELFHVLVPVPGQIVLIDSLKSSH